MFKFHDYLIFPNSRRAFIVTIETKIALTNQIHKNIEYVNYLEQIPNKVNNGYSIVESLTILEYLEAKYINTDLLPTLPEALGIMRLVNLMTVNDLLPILKMLFDQAMGISEENPVKIKHNKQKLAQMLAYLEVLLGNSTYFGGETPNLADFVAGSIIPWFPIVGFELSDFPKLKAWCHNLGYHEAWQKSQSCQASMAEWN